VSTPTVPRLLLTSSTGWPHGLRAERFSSSRSEGCVKRTLMPRGVQRSRLIWRRTPRRHKQAPSLKPSTLRAVVVLQRNSLKWYRITIAAARGGDRDERSQARTGLDPASQRGLNIGVRMRHRNYDVVVVSWCQHESPSLPRAPTCCTCHGESTSGHAASRLASFWCMLLASVACCGSWVSWRSCGADGSRSRSRGPCRLASPARMSGTPTIRFLKFPDISGRGTDCGHPPVRQDSTLGRIQEGVARDLPGANGQ
jgi:hypothetical protein